MENKVKTISVVQELTIGDVQDILCSAFEGGSNYWYRIEEFIKPTEFTHYSWGPPEEGKQQEVFRHIDYPTNPGGALLISDFHGTDGVEEDMVVKRLDLESIEKGLNTMAKQYPHHFKNVMSDSADAETGDVLLQCCLFGKLVYG